MREGGREGGEGGREGEGKEGEREGEGRNNKSTCMSSSVHVWYGININSKPAL